MGRVWTRRRLGLCPQVREYLGGQNKKRSHFCISDQQACKSGGFRIL